MFPSMGQCAVDVLDEGMVNMKSTKVQVREVSLSWDIEALTEDQEPFLFLIVSL